MEEATVKKRGRSVSLTKKQLATAVGVDLLAMCQSITSDGSISSAEASALKRWLSNNADHDLPGISHLVPVVDRILADGIVTADEERELYSAIEAVLPPDIRGVAKSVRRDVEREKSRERRRLARRLKRQKRVASVFCFGPSAQ